MDLIYALISWHGSPVDAVVVVELDQVPDDPFDRQLELATVGVVASQNPAEELDVALHGRLQALEKLEGTFIQL